jgi:hypothetical protein
MTRLHPRQQRILGEGQPMGNLAHALLSVTVAGMADPARFRRGKAYAADGSVSEVEVEPGLLRGWVQGSRAEAYEVAIAVELMTPPARVEHPERGDINRLMPQPEQMVVSCTCPDWDDPCKHAVAVLLAFAGELTDDPALLVEWRCPLRTNSRVAVGSRAAAGPPVEPPDPFSTPVWRTFLGDPADVPVAPFPHSEPVAFAAADVHGVDLGALLSDAVRRVAR